MAKAKVKRDEETKGFFKQLFTITKAISFLAPLLVFVTLVSYGMLVKATMKVSFEKGLGWPSIEVTPKPKVGKGGVPTVPMLGDVVEQKMVSKHLYDLEVKKRESIEKAFHEFREKAIEISRLPPKLQGTPDEVMIKAERIVEYCDTVWYCCGVIAAEVARKISIDTNGPAGDKDAEEAHKCLQILLNKIGYCSGPIDANWRKTNVAVLDFQKNYCPPADGKVGSKTWLAMVIKLAQEVCGQVQSR